MNRLFPFSFWSLTDCNETWKISPMELLSTTLTYGWICIIWSSVIICKSSRCTTHCPSDQFLKAARTFIFCWRTTRTSVAGYEIGIINLLSFLRTTGIDTMNIADSFQFVIRPCTTFVAPAFFYIWRQIKKGML